VAANLLIVGSTDRQLEDTLRAFGMIVSSAPGSELASLAQPGVKQPDLLILDLREQNHLPTALPVLKRQHPLTGVLIVADRLDPGLLLESMRAGVNEVVAAPLVATEVQAAINRLLALRPAGAAGGTAYAFLGAKGGVGTTTVAVNVAAAIAKLAPGNALLVDLHLTNGDASIFLGAEPRFSIVDALENTHRLDEAFFRGLTVKTKAGVDLLASSDRLMAAPLDARRVRQVIDVAERYYKHVVLDVPRTEPSVLDALEGVGRIVLVANQELATVRSASRMATALRQRYGKDSLSVVISRSDRLAEIGHEDIERAVGITVKHSFPSDYRRALQALNKGRPITLENHNDLSSSFLRFARSLTGIAKPEPERAASRFTLFGARK
jgi:pilus assembly protein CpaE